MREAAQVCCISQEWARVFFFLQQTICVLEKRKCLAVAGHHILENTRL
jgi:hypothetical protein